MILKTLNKNWEFDATFGASACLAYISLDTEEDSLKYTLPPIFRIYFVKGDSDDR